MKKIAILAIAALVSASAFADGFNSGSSITIGGKTSDFTTWDLTGNNPTDIGPLTDLTITAATINWWSDNSNGGADMAFVLWDGGSTAVGSWQSFNVGASTYVGGDYNHDYTVSLGEAKDLNTTWNVSLVDGKEYYLDMKVKTYGNDDNWYPSSDESSFYHAKFTYTAGTTPSGVPEPATMSLLGLGALAMVIRRKLSK